MLRSVFQKGIILLLNPKKVIVLCICLMTLSHVFSQQLDWEWVKSIGVYPYGLGYKSFDIDNEGNSVFSCSSIDTTYLPGINIENGQNNHILKYDNLGNFLWHKTIFGDIDITAIAIDESNNIYFGGRYYSVIIIEQDTIQEFTYTNNIVCKLNPEGNLIWHKTFGGQYYCQNIEVKEDNLFIGGSGEDIYIENDTVQCYYPCDIQVLLYDTAGNYKWCNIFGGAYCDHLKAITVDKNNNVLQTGEYSEDLIYNTQNIISGGGTFITRFDETGELDWVNHCLATPHPSATGTSIVCDNSDDVIVSGYFSDTVWFGGISLTTDIEGIFITKLNNNGTYDWVKQIDGNSGLSNKYCIQTDIDENDNIYLIGSFKDSLTIDSFMLISEGESDIFCIKFNPDGNVIWAKQTGGRNDEYFTNIKIKNTDLYAIGRLSDTAYFGNFTIAANWSKKSFIGKIDLESTTNIFSDNRNNESSINIFPNPASNIINIESFNMNDSRFSTEIYNVFGQRVYSKELISKFNQINISDFSAGIYFISLKSDNYSTTKKIIKQ